MSFKIKRPILNPFDNVIDLFAKLNMIDNPMPDKILFNPPATILFKDGKKYVAKCHPDDTFDEEQGLMVALLKSFGIKYMDLQEMLKNAKRPKAKVKEVDVNEGKSYNPADDMIDAVDYAMSGFRGGKIPEIKKTLESQKRKYGRPIKTEVKPKRPVGRPKKIKTEEPKPKRPVGRPRKQKFEVGDWVMLKWKDENDIMASTDYMFMIQEIRNDNTALIKTQHFDLGGIYPLDRLELIMKGVRNDK